MGAGLTFANLKIGDQLVAEWLKLYVKAARPECLVRDAVQVDDNLAQIVRLAGLACAEMADRDLLLSALGEGESAALVKASTSPVWGPRAVAGAGALRLAMMEELPERVQRSALQRVGGKADDGAPFPFLPGGRRTIPCLPLGRVVETGPREDPEPQEPSAPSP